MDFRGDGFDNLRCYCVSCGSFLPLCLSSDRVTASSACGASRAFSLSHKTRTSSPHARPCLVCLLSFHAKHGSPARRSSDLVSPSVGPVPGNGCRNDSPPARFKLWTSRVQGGLIQSVGPKRNGILLNTFEHCRPPSGSRISSVSVKNPCSTRNTW
jgi:hypothetical protein